VTDVIANNENTNKQLEQVNKKVEKLVKVNDEVKARNEDLVNKIKFINNAVTEMRVEMEQMKKRNVDLMKDQHNATNQPPTENTNKQLEQINLEEVNNKVENFFKQNDVMSQELQQVQQQNKEMKQLVIEMKNEMKQLKKRNVNLMKDQHNATNQPPVEKETKFYSFEYFFTKGFGCFIDPESSNDIIKMSYREWYEMLCCKTTQNLKKYFEKHLLMKRKSYETSNYLYFCSGNRVTDTLQIQRRDYASVVDEGWSDENTKHVLLLHPTDASKRSCLSFMDIK